MRHYVRFRKGGRGLHIVRASGGNTLLAHHKFAAPETLWPTPGMCPLAHLYLDPISSGA